MPNSQTSITILRRLLFIVILGTFSLAGCNSPKVRSPDSRTSQSDSVGNLQYELSKLKSILSNSIKPKPKKQVWADSVSFKPELINVQIGEKYGYINPKGKTVIPGIFDKAVNFSGDYATVSYRDKFGIIDRQGKIVIPFEYDSLNKFSDRIIASKAGKQGVIDRHNKIVISFQFDEIVTSFPQVTIVKNNDILGFVNEKQEFTPFTVKNNGDYLASGIVILRHHDHYQDRFCVANKQGQLLIPFVSGRSDKAAKMNNACLSLVGKKIDNSTVEIPNTEGQYIQETSFERYFREGLLQVLINDKYGYINLDSKLAIAPIYDRVGDFSEGLAAVKQGKQFSFINTAGETVFIAQNYLPYSQYLFNSRSRKDCPPNYIPNQYSKFENGLAIVSQIDNFKQQDKQDCKTYEKPRYYYLNRQNQIVKGETIYTAFEEAVAIAPNLIKIKTTTGYGIVKSDGEIITRPNLEYIGDFQGEYASAKHFHNDKTTWIDKTGKPLSKLPQ